MEGGDFLGDKPILTGQIQKNRQKVATIALWLNDKEGNDKRPDFKGKVTSADGNDVSYVSLWIRDEDGVGKMRVKLVEADA